MQCNTCKKDVKPDIVNVRRCVYIINGKQEIVERELCPRCYAKYEALDRLEALSKKGQNQMDKYINQSMKQVCADIEIQQSWEDEKFMEELDSQMSLGDLEESAWKSYRAGVCPCGDAECGGIAWMLNSDDPFEF